MAGSWLQLESDKGSLNSSYSRPLGLRYQFIADAEDGSIPDLPVLGAGFVFGIDVEFDGVTAPNELTLIMKTKYGNTQWSPAKLTASGFLKPDSPESAPNGFVLTATQTAVATNSAKGVLTVHIG
jgi:hypothetical protein